MAHPIEIRRWLRLPTKGGSGFPNGEQDLLKKIIAIVATSEPVDHMMQDGTVVACPVCEPLLLFDDIHEFAVK